VLLTARCLGALGSTWTVGRRYLGALVFSAAAVVGEALGQMRTGHDSCCLQT
jgi:hypothetical protein